MLSYCEQRKCEHGLLYTVHVRANSLSSEGRNCSYALGSLPKIIVAAALKIPPGP